MLCQRGVGVKWVTDFSLHPNDTRQNLLDWRPRGSLTDKLLIAKRKKTESRVWSASLRLCFPLSQVERTKGIERLRARREVLCYAGSVAQEHCRSNSLLGIKTVDSLKHWLWIICFVLFDPTFSLIYFCLMRNSWQGREVKYSLPRENNLRQKWR